MTAWVRGLICNGWTGAPAIETGEWGKTYSVFVELMMAVVVSKPRYGLEGLCCYTIPFQFQFVEL